MTCSNCWHYMHDDFHSGGYCDLLCEEVFAEENVCGDFYDENEDDYFDDDIEINDYTDAMP